VFGEDSLDPLPARFHGEPERIFTEPTQPETQRFLRRLLQAGRL
jgi:hypothetical protein